MGRPRTSPEKRFWPKVDKSGDCWVWSAGKDQGGYGRFRDADSGKTVKAHRVSFLLSGAAIPAGQLVLHRCDNPPCVRPDHLFLGDSAANAADRNAKGRQARGQALASAMVGRRATGERHGAYTKPERVPRGERHGMAKLTAESVALAREMYAGGATKASIAAALGVDRTTVSRSLKGESWRHV